MPGRFSVITLPCMDACNKSLEELLLSSNGCHAVDSRRIVIDQTVEASIQTPVLKVPHELLSAGQKLHDKSLVLIMLC